MFLADTRAAELLMDPGRQTFEGSSAYAVLGVSLLVMLAGLAVVFVVVRRLGKPTGGVDTETAILGLPVTLAVLALPILLMPMMFGEQANSMPAITGMLQIGFVLAGIWMLLWNPYKPADDNSATPRSPIPDWLRLKPIWLVYVLVIWVISYVALQSSMFASVAITNLFDIEATTQPQINDMLARDDPPWIAGYYLLVAVAAPLREELAFRVIAFGGLTVMFTSLLNRDGNAENRSQPKIAMIMAALVSTLLFVIAHGAWAAGILPLTVLSLTLTGLYAYTGSIWPPVMFHALHNGLVVSLQFFYLSH